MALSTRYNNTGNALLGGTRYGTNRENADALLGRPAAVKGKTNASVTTRAALGNISNNATTVNSQYGTLKGTYKEPAVRGRAAIKKETFQKPATEKENAVSTIGTAKDSKMVVKKETQDKVVVKEKLKVASPSPMDISVSQELSDAFSKQLLPVNVEDIDKDDGDNPQLVAEYVNDIYDYMRDLERKFSVRRQYLDGLEINGRMRGILIDWLVQVHLRFHLLQETLYLTVAIIDRYLQEQEVARSKLQLVGVTAMLIASKYEEMYAPEIADFVYITDNAYTKSDIRKMECIILKTLDFKLGRPLPLHFLRRNSKAGEVDANTHTLAKYLMELTIVDYEMVHVHPSQIAASALCLSMKILDTTNSNWSSTLHHYSKYSEEELQPIMQKLCSLISKAGTGKLTAIKTKYAGSKFLRISSIPELKSSRIQELAKSSES
jgi:cyclin B